MTGIYKQSYEQKQELQDKFRVLFKFIISDFKVAIQRCDTKP